MSVIAIRDAVKKNGALRFLINRYTLFVGFIYLQMLVNRKLGGVPVRISTLRMEIPLLLVCYWFFNRILRRNRFQPYIAAMPLMLAYAWYDVYYLVFGQIFRPATVHELPILFYVLPAQHIAVILTAALLPVAVFLLDMDWRRRMKAIATGALCLGIFCYAIAAYPGIFISVFRATERQSFDWSDYESAGRNGRFMLMVMREAQRRQAVNMLSSYRDGPAYEQRRKELKDFVAQNSNGRNVHLIILESLLDPTLFNKLKFSSSPYHPEFRKIFGDETGFSVSPVFAGGTAQAEFEALCGVPAYRRISSVEFNEFNKAPVDCLPQLLRGSGYRTMASHPYKPELYNRLNAYPSIGFGELYFPKEYHGGNSWLSVSGKSGMEMGLFDLDLYNQLLAFPGSTKSPVFDYVLGMYGHYPESLDAKLRPPVIKTYGGDDNIDSIANQFYYRTGAIAELVNGLRQKDPRCLIIVLGDHLPALSRGLRSYRDLNYLPSAKDPAHTTRIFIVRDGKPAAYQLVHHYDIPGIILDYVTDGKYCLRWKCPHLGAAQDKNLLLDNYMHIMAEGVK